MAVQAVLGSAATAAGVLAEPSEWNFGVRPRGHVVTRVVHLRPAPGAQTRITRLHGTGRSVEARILRQEGMATAPAEVEVSVHTDEHSGRISLSLFITFDDPEAVAMRFPISGWVRPKEGPGTAEVFYATAERSGARFLRWWRTAAGSAASRGRVELLAIENVAHYKRLRALERSTPDASPPADIMAFIDGEIVLKGEGEVTAGLAGFLDLDSAGRLDRSHRPATEQGAGHIPPPAAEGLLEVWFFYFSDCRNCEEAKQAVQRLARDRAGMIEVRIFDATADAESIALAFATLGVQPDAPKAVPSAVAFVGDELLLSADEVVAYSAKMAEKQLRRGGERLRVRRPEEVMPLVERAKSLELVPVVLAGLADGVNPCAFAAMVLLISVLSAGGLSAVDPRSRRQKLALGGSAFCAAVFVTYYLAGFALFSGVRQLRAFPVAEAAVFWAIWALALVGGILSAVDAVAYSRTGDSDRVRLKVPEGLRRRFAPLLRGRFGRYGLVLGGLVGGVLIAIMEGICTGQMYLPTIQYMARTPGLRARGALYLLLYNLLFVLPLLVILGVALAGVHFHRLNAFLRRHLGGAKILLAAVFFLLAVAMILGR